ncbi:DMT family transporter [Thalassospira sp. TSL5-1]|uniref:DMT family transporter n=1 Tax=Thalassospira sp. TSL5-1 TaxID=1544451 RepID=UPI000A807A65|nr:DMT family transporter [Thalassospira sp. TSL5-1]
MSMPVPKSTSPSGPGFQLVCLSAVMFSTMGVFTKGVDADAWSIILWRGLVAAVVAIILLALRGELTREIRRFHTPAILATLLMASGTAAFIQAFKLTTIANVAMIYAAAPFVAALFGWLFLRERPTATILLGSFAALVGVAVIFGGLPSKGDLWGKLLAGWMTLVMAGITVIYRRWPDTPSTLPGAVSALLLSPIAAGLGTTTSIAPNEMVILAGFGLCFAVAFILLSTGARHLPPAETALLSALETPLAPIWGVLFFHEIPTGHTVLGGSLIIVAVFGTYGQQWRHKRKQARLASATGPA